MVDGGAEFLGMAHRSLRSVIPGRMPADADPAAPGRDDRWVIHLQNGDRGPPDRCQAEDDGAVLAPAEVPAPPLTARVEQRYQFVCQWITSVAPGALELVARMAGDAQILPDCLPAACFGDDVVNDKPCAGDRSERMTVRTPAAGIGEDTTA